VVGIAYQRHRPITVRSKHLDEVLRDFSVSSGNYYSTISHVDRLPSEHRRQTRRARARQGTSESRDTGHDIHLGPPRPDPSSEPLIRSTSIPDASSRALVSTLRS